MSVLTAWKTSDLDRLPDEPFLRYEIVDGGVIVSKRPDWTHQDMVRKLIVAFDARWLVSAVRRYRNRE
ncbi:MAG: hypothetical protein DMG14_23915 [Acidobacteria bacterium]|nr:MAG: hypothetical protein DMG14_23915 [Acidobacteriota bacterium]